ncbi:MAG: methyltransferase domain-containing protein [Ferruginibacter sp.]
MDAACGVGYGSHHLAKNTSAVIKAIDRSEEALDIARKNFAAENISFLEDDCHTLQNAAAFAPYDYIVSFETLEHLPQPALFIRNCFTNLKAGGKLIVSTPNQPVSSPGGQLNWEFHEKEYTVSELRDILAAEGFSNILIYGQHTTGIGKLRSEFRAALNTINSNPFIRLGRWVQSFVRGRKFPATLPEQTEDFEIISYQKDEDITAQGENGPFVLIAVCEKR